tara:strand:+ start:1660 stop:2451 length:792 start_codon:yes stop_codon:yes gene_type:complete
MSDYLLAILLSLIQGLTEFLPISSSAHLQFPELVFGTKDLGLLFDVVAHAGTLLAVIYYFRTELKEIILSWVPGNSYQNQQRFNEGLCLIIATLPMIALGLGFMDLVENWNLLAIAYTNIIFAIILLIANKLGSQNKELRDITLKMALVIGCFQMFAIFPGASRSGMAITGALAVGMSLHSSARFAFLLSIPAILGALSIMLLKDWQNLNADEYILLFIGFTVSSIIAFLTIHIFLKLVNRIGMAPFVIYRLLLGLMILIAWT